jgi:hypothetical protein
MAGSISVSTDNGQVVLHLGETTEGCYLPLDVGLKLADTLMEHVGYAAEDKEARLLIPDNLKAFVRVEKDRLLLRFSRSVFRVPLYPAVARGLAMALRRKAVELMRRKVHGRIT